MHWSSMNSLNMFLCVSQLVHLLLMATQVECLNFSYPRFTIADQVDFNHTEKSNIASGAIQVTLDQNGAPMTNLSGRIWYKNKFKLWSTGENKNASFNSTFVLNITPQGDSWGEGLAFILTKEGSTASIPDNSYGQWLGIVNASTNGSSENNVVAIEFDTRKSYPEDVEGNHIGVDINSVYSIEQVSLNGHGVNLSNGNISDVKVRIQYDGELKTLAVYALMVNITGGNMSNPILNMSLDLSKHLPEDVFVGFSGSTGEYPQLNCIKSWDFISTDIDGDGGQGNDTDGDGVPFLWLWISLPVVLVVLLSGLCVYLCRKWRNKEMVEDLDVALQIQDSANAPKKFRFKELKHATGNFDPRNTLGKGGCGLVYKGMLSNTEVAVKRFSKDSTQGKQEFIAEITIIGNLRHKNLVKLVGWCYESNELLVVYEFMPNGSLDKLIFRDRNENTPRAEILSWERRHGIIFGVAQALDYLHNGCEKRVLHRDIKASNIMLDLEYNARLGDFGLARTIQLSGKTHHSTKEIAGTPGYMAPESFHTGRATVETDVYAFGVLVLEVACGRKPRNQNEHNNYDNRIIDSVWELYRMEKIIDAVDIRLNGEFEEEQVEWVLKLGLACCHPNPYQRPSMRFALQVITGEAPPPPLPIEKPAFTWPAMPTSFNDSLSHALMEGEISPITILSGR